MNSSKLALFVAAALGLVGAAVNWIYLDSRSKQSEKIEFLSVAPTANILPGDRFTEDKLAALAIPKNNVKARAVRPSHQLGRPADGDRHDRRYPFEGGEIILRQRLKTPPPRWS